MPYEVPLESFPSNLALPAEVRDRFWYDDTRRRLVFDGFMSKALFGQLWSLSKDHGYRRALEELFRISTPAQVPSPRGRGIVIAAGITLLVLPAPSRFIVGEMLVTLSRYRQIWHARFPLESLG